MPDRDEIFEKVKEQLVEALGVDDDEVTSDATLMGDLEAESIDFLDIVFQLEQEFDLKIQRSELFPSASDLGEDTDALIADGKLTDDGVLLLKERMHHVNQEKLDEFLADPTIEKTPDLYTVEMIVNFLEQRLKQPT